MSRMNSGTNIHRRKPGPDVYTALAAVATIVLAVGVVYVGQVNLSMTRDVPEIQSSGGGTQAAVEGGQPSNGMNPFHILGGDD